MRLTLSLTLGLTEAALHGCCVGDKGWRGDLSEEELAVELHLTVGVLHSAHRLRLRGEPHESHAPPYTLVSLESPEGLNGAVAMEQRFQFPGTVRDGHVLTVDGSEVGWSDDDVGSRLGRRR